MRQPGAADILVAARRALLDALDALAEHLAALVLVGAQAIYLHTGRAQVALAESTKDSDIAINPHRLGDDLDAAQGTPGASPISVYASTEQSGFRPARREYGDASKWRRIYEAKRDRIQNPDLIHSGQVMDISRDR